MATIAVLAAMLVGAGPAAAAVRYASPSGSGTACSEAAPCSIGTAVDPAMTANGDEVIVLPGDYSLTSTQLNIGDAISVRRNGSSSTLDRRSRRAPFPTAVWRARSATASARTTRAVPR